MMPSYTPMPQPIAVRPEVVTMLDDWEFRQDNVIGTDLPATDLEGFQTRSSPQMWATRNRHGQARLMQGGSRNHFTRVVDDYPCPWREFEPADLTQPRRVAFQCQLWIDVAPVRGPVMVDRK